MKALKLIRKIVNILKSIPDHDDFQPKKYALNLCLNHKMIDDACKMYDLIIESQTNIVDKSQMLEDFANYCAKWGRLEQANIILQRKLSI